MRPSARSCLLLLLWLLLVGSLGCGSGIGVRRSQTHSLLHGWKASVAGDDEGLSPRTLQTLRQLDLVRAHGDDPGAVVGRLHELAARHADPDLLFALAEVSYTQGRKLEKNGNPEAIAYYYLCAGYAYHYLFGADSKIPAALLPVGGDGPPPCGPEEVFDPRFRLACDLYNNGLAKCIRAAQKVGRLDPRQKLHLPTGDRGVFTLSVRHHGFAWSAEEFGSLLFCSDYQVVGLQNHFRTYGLGVPLIGVRGDVPQPAPCHVFYPTEVSFPVTAFFRFDGSVADLGTQRAGRLELYNPLAIRKVGVRGRVVPLETDLTTPLAYFLSRTDLQGVEYTGLLRTELLHDRKGIYLFEPYQPGKVPVLMVHGLFSSPLTWAPLFNELRADPVLNQHCQFWFYLYPTGNPYLASAADLRLALNHLRHEIDPERRDPALDQMVLVGHSMGGLVGKLMTQDSGTDFWDVVGTQPFETVKADPDVKAKLHQIFFFDRQPAVRRVVFIGTPHRGSMLSPSLIGRVTNSMIRLPKHLISTADDVFEKNPGLWKEHGGYFSRKLPTSIDLLNPNSPALHLLAGRPIPPEVKYHSIIGVTGGEGAAANDGVVYCSSAHLDGADTELVVQEQHTVLHHHPRSMLEVRRILYKHLAELGVLQLPHRPPPVVGPTPESLPEPRTLPPPKIKLELEELPPPRH